MKLLRIDEKSVGNKMDNSGLRKIKKVIRKGNFNKIDKKRKKEIRGNLGKNVGRMFSGCIIEEIIEILGKLGKLLRWNKKIVRRNLIERRNLRRVMVEVGKKKMKKKKKLGGEWRIIRKEMKRIFIDEKRGNKIKNDIDNGKYRIYGKIIMNKEKKEERK